MGQVFDFIQTACILIVFSYLLSRANFFSELQKGKKLSRAKQIIVVLCFLLIALYGNARRGWGASSLYVDTRVAGIALSGLLFGPGIALSVFVPTAAVSLFLGGTTLTADLIAMALTVLVTGRCHKRFPRFDAVLSGIITGLLEILHMLIIVLTVEPMTEAKELVYSISFPMIVVNGLAVLTFVLIIQDVNEHKQLWEKESFSASELSVARNIQTAMLEKNFMLDPRLDLTAFLEPAYQVGGDLYSFLLDDGRFFKFMVGDVSGKGFPAAITMSRCETLFQEIILHEAEPAAIMSALNKRLCRNNKAQMFVTGVVGCLDLETGELLYANAGHTVCILTEPDAVRELPRPQGRALGVLPKSVYAQERIVLQPGQHMVLYTDGVTEAENDMHELFGTERLIESLGVGFSMAMQAQEQILRDVRSFCGAMSQSDDITLLIFGRMAQTEGREA